MIDKVRRFVEEDCLLENGDRVIAALSGGADSVALLHILISLKEEYNLYITALHFHHGIRGEEADRDAAFCRALCEEWGIPFSDARADVPYHAARTGESLELCGRRMRYHALEYYADELGGAKIATAHHMGDNTETVLLNLVRGSGIGGLCGIPARRGDIIRPLLCVTREEIEDYCRQNELSYVTDSTNLDDAYTRNKLRLNVLPALRQINPALDESVARMTAVMRDADEYLNKISLKELKGCRTEYGYSCADLLALDKAVFNYAIMHVLEDAEAPVNYRHIGLIAQAMADGGCVDLGRGFRADCSQGILRITDGGEVADTDFCVPFSEAGGSYLSAERLKVADVADENGKINRKFLQNCIPCDIITGDTVVRHRRAGDTFTDPRRGVTKTLKKLFNEMKIPREKRDGILLIAQGNTVLWIEGVGASKQAQVDPGIHREIYYIRY